MKCKYCEGISNVKEYNLPIVEQPSNKLKVTGNKLSFGIEGLRGQWSYGSGEINYCPMCGKKL